MIWNERIKTLRLLNRMTLKEIAACLGVTEATAQRYESNGIKTIPYDAIIEYAKIFGCSPQYIMGWESSSCVDLSDIEQELISAYRQAPDAIKTAVKKLLDVGKNMEDKS